MLSSETGRQVWSCTETIETLELNINDEIFDSKLDFPLVSFTKPGVSLETTSLTERYTVDSSVALKTLLNPF